MTIYAINLSIDSPCLTVFLNNVGSSIQKNTTIHATQNLILVFRMLQSDLKPFQGRKLCYYEHLISPDQKASPHSYNVNQGCNQLKAETLFSKDPRLTSKLNKICNKILEFGYISL